MCCWHGQLECLPDIFVSSKNEEQYKIHLREVFSHLHQVSHANNGNKCLFCILQLDFLGHHVSA